MRQIVRPAAAYLTVVFCAAFVLGTIRVLWVIPRLGDVAAVLIEGPVVLALSWVVAGAVLRRWPLPERRARVAMGGLAFIGLILLELVLGRFVFGRSFSGILANMGTPAGLIGLAGQIGFGLIPALCQPRG
jgi:hypothetical protein